MRCYCLPHSGGDVSSTGPTTTYPLDRALPPDVVTRTHGGAASYFSFPVFSRPWFWGRARIFGSIAILLGVFQSANVWILLHDLRLGFLCLAVATPIWVAIVLAGPAFATIVRHRRWAPRWEALGVVAAIAAGLAVSFTGQMLANRFSKVFLTAPLIEAHVFPEAIRTYVPDASRVAFAVLCQTLIFLGIGGGPALRSYFGEQRRWREGLHQRELDSLRRQKSAADMRLTVLQAQVEPHFLFNTLASVRSLVSQDPQRAEATIDALVDHLRATMPRLRGEADELRPTLAEQIEVCASYLALMQVRMGDRLHYGIEVPESLRTFAFPPLILISLVENAIKHGIEPKSGGGSVWIRAELDGWGDGQRLLVTVEDDGLGLRPGLSDGVGLSNVRAQLAARFGERGSLSLVSHQGGGVSATVRVPVAEASP